MTDPKPQVRVYVDLDAKTIQFARGNKGPVDGDSFFGLARRHGLIEEGEQVELVIMPIVGEHSGG